MVNWIFIIIVLLAIFVFFKITSFRYERWWTYSIGILLFLFVFTFFKVVSNNDLDITTFEGFVSGMKAYVSWLIGFGKTTASITGQATLFDWNVTGNSS